MRFPAHGVSAAVWIMEIRFAKFSALKSERKLFPFLNVFSNEEWKIWFSYLLSNRMRFGGMLFMEIHERKKGGEEMRSWKGITVHLFINEMYNEAEDSLLQNLQAHWKQNKRNKQKKSTSQQNLIWSWNSARAPSNFYHQLGHNGVKDNRKKWLERRWEGSSSQP